MFRNERKIYKRKCGLLDIDTICTQHPDSGLTIYSNKGYFSDQWDPTATGRDFNFHKTFTENLLELRKIAPCQAVDQGDDNQNSEYAQHASSLKNSYMCFASV